MGRESRFAGSVRWYLLITLVAVELLMSFSAFGYIHIEPISVTIGYIPVLVAGACMGPLESMAVGAAFGLAGMWKASASYVMAFDQLFSPALSGRPLAGILLSVGSRMLFGLAVGLLYQLARRGRLAYLWMGLVTCLGSTVHSFFVYTSLWLFFPETGYTPLSALNSLGSLNGLATSAVTTTVVLLLWRLENSRTWKVFQARVGGQGKSTPSERYHLVSLVVALGVTLASSVAVALYFVHRMEYALDYQGVALPEAGYADLVHLQIQFLIGILSLMWIVAVFLIFNRRYATYMAKEAQKDPLTGVLSRRAFFAACAAQLREFPLEGPGGCFLMVDLDRFKEINDNFGHPEGDRALREVARCLQESFGQGIIGRMGGDEFAVFLAPPVPNEELEDALGHFQERVRRADLAAGELLCSMGALLVEAPHPVEELYRNADRLLYRAKSKGRDQYIIGTRDEALREVS